MKATLLSQFWILLFLGILVFPLELDSKTTEQTSPSASIQTPVATTPPPVEQGKKKRKKSKQKRKIRPRPKDNTYDKKAKNLYLFGLLSLISYPIVVLALGALGAALSSIFVVLLAPFINLILLSIFAGLTLKMLDKDLKQKRIRLRFFVILLIAAIVYALGTAAGLVFILSLFELIYVIPTLLFIAALVFALYAAIKNRKKYRNTNKEKLADKSDKKAKETFIFGIVFSSIATLFILLIIQSIGIMTVLEIYIPLLILLSLILFFAIRSIFLSRKNLRKKNIRLRFFILWLIIALLFFITAIILIIDSISMGAYLNFIPIFSLFVGTAFIWYAAIENWLEYKANKASTE
ncbi:MAG: hypothetical protein MK212_03920 [Saprospiraceae bacterium]|nr:hypothetical protein [Saprospiraceae bacterium]